MTLFRDTLYLQFFSQIYWIYLQIINSRIWNWFVSNLKEKKLHNCRAVSILFKLSIIYFIILNKKLVIFVHNNITNSKLFINLHLASIHIHKAIASNGWSFCSLRKRRKRWRSRKEPYVLWPLYSLPSNRFHNSDQVHLKLCQNLPYLKSIKFFCIYVMSISL